jgi:hypothetical protein
MRKETTIVQEFCDECNAELTGIPDKELVTREGYFRLYPNGSAEINMGDWLKFCDLGCAAAYLKAKQAIRFMYDNEDECPREQESVEFCHNCPAFDKVQLFCTNSRYWFENGQNIVYYKCHNKKCIGYRIGIEDGLNVANPYCAKCSELMDIDSDTHELINNAKNKGVDAPAIPSERKKGNRFIGFFKNLRDSIFGIFLMIIWFFHPIK